MEQPSSWEYDTEVSILLRLALCFPSLVQPIAMDIADPVLRILRIRIKANLSSLQALSCFSQLLIITTGN